MVALQDPDSGAAAIFILLMGAPGDAATTLDFACSAHRQTALDPDRRHTLPMTVPTVLAAATGFPMENRLTISSAPSLWLRAISRPNPSHTAPADLYVELPRFRDRGINYRICLRQPQSHVDMRTRGCA